MNQHQMNQLGKIYAGKGGEVNDISLYVITSSEYDTIKEEFPNVKKVEDLRSAMETRGKELLSQKRKGERMKPKTYKGKPPIGYNEDNKPVYEHDGNRFVYRAHGVWAGAPRPVFGKPWSLEKLFEQGRTEYLTKAEIKKFHTPKSKEYATIPAKVKKFMPAMQQKIVF